MAAEGSGVQVDTQVMLPFPLTNDKVADDESDSSKTCVFVGNLAQQVTESNLKELFMKFGTVLELNINFGFASVQMATNSSADNAVRQLDGIELYGKTITVKVAPVTTNMKINTSTTSIKVENLSPMVTNERLHEAFTLFGEVTRAVVIVDNKGLSTTRGIIEFESEISAQNAVNQIEEGSYLTTTFPKPLTALLMEDEDSICGLPEEKITKTTEYFEETKAGPRFASMTSFEAEVARTFKIRYEQERQQRQQFEENIRSSRIIFEAQMRECWKKQQLALQIKQEVLSHEENEEERKKEFEARKRIRMEAQIMELYQSQTQRRNNDETPTKKMGKQERQEKRKQLVSIYKADGDWQAASRILNVPASTAYRWVHEGYKEDNRGGHRDRCSTVTDQHREFMVHLIECAPKITLDGISDGLIKELNLSVSKTTISRHLDGKMYSFKPLPLFDPDRANSDENKRARKALVDQLLESRNRGCVMLYMDATNFNVHTSPHTQGPFKKGTRCTTVAEGSKGAKLHVVAAISSAGLVHHQMKMRDTFTKEDIVTIVRNSVESAKLQLSGSTPVTVVMNSTTMCQVEQVEDVHIIRLPPHSPMLNPVELIWAVMKRHVRQELPRETEAISTSTIYYQPQPTVPQLRCRALDLSVTSGMLKITPELCANCIAQVEGRMCAVVNLEDIY